MGSAVSKKPVVLVVEDETLTRTCALDEAIQILERRTDIRAVFTDIQMPGSMDGLRLAQAVRHRWPPVALIVTSGKTDVSNTDLPSGGRFLSKPYRPAQIAESLRELI